MKDSRMHIDTFCKIAMNRRSFLRREYQSYYLNNYEIEGINGVVSPEILNCFLNFSKHRRLARALLPGVLCFADGYSVSDENFNAILALRGKDKSTLLSTLGHAELSYYQMQILNTLPQSLEAFSWLFDKICSCDCFTIYDMEKILVENCDVTNQGIENCIREAVIKYGVSPKVEFAKQWVKHH